MHYSSEYADPQWQRRLNLLRMAFVRRVFTQDDLVNPLDGQDSIYPETVNLPEMLKQDRYHLRDMLDVHIEPVGGPGSRGKYELKRVGARFADIFLPAGLVSLIALAQLPQAAPHFPPALVKELLDNIRARLGKDGADILNDALNNAAQLAVWRDQNQINGQVLHVLRRAIQERRLAVFEYQPNRSDDDDRRRHTVEPYEIYPQDGHLYLRCYAIHTIGPFGETPGNHYHLRIGRIVPESITLSDDHFTLERQRPRVTVHYVLSRKLAKDGGSVTFNEIERRTLLDGRVEIRANTDSAFSAVRKLLGYGAEVEVLGGVEVRTAYQDEVRRMAAQLHTPTS
jgi:predicted DNA-binding transcriptional regulator YafY